MLEIRNLRSGYGRIEILHGIDLRVAPGEIVALVGANGAGKSTLLKSISGLVASMSGAITFAGTSLASAATSQRVRSGIAHVPEGRQVFGELSVAENLHMGAYLQLRSLSNDELLARAESVYVLFPALRERAALPAGRLSGGQQQMLAIGRGLMAQPALLLLDEPSLGLAPALVSDIFRTLAALRTSGISILLAEQNARLSLALADRGYVLENGTIAESGPASELLDSPTIIERYLGLGAAHGEPIPTRPQTLRLAHALRTVLGT